MIPSAPLSTVRDVGIGIGSGIGAATLSTF
jgi:hypothetical protein